MTETLAEVEDLEAVMMRSLPDSQQQKATELLIRASALFRVKAPWIDDRIADGTYDRTSVATVVAGIVKRVIDNPRGAMAVSTGPYSASFQSYRTPGLGNDGTLEVTAADLKKLSGPNRSGLGTIHVQPGLAPRSAFGGRRTWDTEPGWVDG